jgi:hypothetical protein
LSDYIGDFSAGAVARYLFATTAGGVPTTLAGTPAVSIYKDNNTSEGTTGVSLSVDYDSRTGLNLLAIDLSADPTFFSAASDFTAVITAGTIGGATAVGRVLCQFSIANRSTSAILTLLTTVATYVDTEVAAIKAKTDQLTFTLSGKVDASIQAAGDFAQAAADKIWSSVTRTLTSASGLTAAQVWDYLTASMTTSGSVGAYLLSKLALISTGSVSIRSAVSLDGSFEIVSGDSYTYAEGTAIDFAVGAKTWPTTLTGYTISITVDDADGATLLTDSMSIVTPTGSSQTVRWAPTASKTSVATGYYKYEIKATKSSEVKRLELGIVRIRPGTT